MKTIRHAGCAALLVVLGLSAGCGMSPKAEAPSHDGSPAPALASPTSSQDSQEEAAAEPTTLADAEALLEKARADLDRLALNEPGMPGASAGAAAPPPAPATATAPRDQAKRAEKASADEAPAQAPEPAPAKEANTCETACKAFSSLTRASDAVCRLDTDGGKRCERARQIRANASQRVASCGCAK